MIEYVVIYTTAALICAGLGVVAYSLFKFDLIRCSCGARWPSKDLQRCSVCRKTVCPNCQHYPKSLTGVVVCDDCIPYYDGGERPAKVKEQ